MGYQRRSRPIDYKSYGQKKKPGRKTRISKGTLLLILLIGGAFFWLVHTDQENANRETLVTGTTSTERKNIYDRFLQPLAVSFELYAVYVKPLEVEDSFQTGETIATILGLDRDQLIKRLRTERSFIWLGQQIPKDKVVELTKLNIAGLYFQKSPVRYYPHDQTAAQVLGYVKGEQGLAGIELYYDKELRGRAFTKQRPGSGAETFAEGRHVVLTLDLKIQTILEKQMAVLLDKTQASSVAAMAVNPANGEILAAVQRPSFNPNSFWDATPQSQKMEMVSRVMRPGGLSGLFRYGAAVHAGRDIRMRTVNDVPAPLIRPRQLKSGGRARAGYWWPWPGGGFISDELAELPDPTISEEEMRKFQTDLGISCADVVDVPAKANSPDNGDPCGSGRLNGISMLGAFSRLVNGGKPVALHFLKGTVDGEGNFASYQFQAQGRELAKVSAVLQRSFAASAGEKAPMFAAEYLYPLGQEDDFVLESQEGDQATEIIESQPTYDGMLVAAAPVEKPELVLLISVQNGEFDLAAASPMRRFGDSFLRLARKEMTRRAEEPTSYALPAETALFEQWQQLQRRPERAGQRRKVKIGTMPDLLGKSLRKALLALMDCQVEVAIEGAGQVVGQQPEAGAPCGKRVTLRLAVPAREKKE